MHDPFPTTAWTEFFAVRDSADPEARRLALGFLYERYWNPLYSYLRSRGFEREESADLLQGFFVFMLERETVDRLDLSGKLRAFLIAMLKNYVADTLDRAGAQKRRPVEPLLSLDVEAAERGFREIAALNATPEQVYERRWAEDMVKRAQQRLEKNEADSGRAEVFEQLRDPVFDNGREASYGEIAERLGLSLSATKVRIHRLRKRLGRFLREDIALTVTDSGAVDEELRHLLSLAE